MTIDAADVSVTLAGREVLSGVSLSLAAGMLTVVVGPNGAGKSTLLKALTGTLPPSRGDIVFENRPISDWPRRHLARRRAVLAQNQHLAFPFTVFEVVALGQTSGVVHRSAALRRLVLASLGAVDLAGYAGRLFQQLSGGEQQRVQIARVLCQMGDAPASGDCRWLFLDEPTSSLDVGHQLAVLDVARSHAHGGGGAVAVLHDLNLASLYADRLIVLQGGRVVGDGVPADVLEQSLVRSVFGERVHVVTDERSGRPFVYPALGAQPAVPQGQAGGAAQEKRSSAIA